MRRDAEMTKLFISTSTHLRFTTLIPPLVDYKKLVFRFFLKRSKQNGTVIVRERILDFIFNCTFTFTVGSCFG